MSKIQQTRVSTGIYWLSIPDAGLNILCGCPADSVKHLMKKGLIKMVRRKGVRFETGPNAILLSDLPLQNGHFSNLAEFPILQMLYRQGMLLPNHPNNTGIKPILIGREEVVRAQMSYIYRGNYGLTSDEEMKEAGIDEKQARELMRVKLSFAFGKIHPSEDLLEPVTVINRETEIRNGVHVTRRGINRYRFSYLDEKVDVDLNLKENENYETPYELGSHHFPRGYFTVVHTGEGDGWDVNRPCMASVLNFQGRIYLIDAGPNIFHSLHAMGIDINEVDGIFHTHCHDDHFAGLTTLIRANHRIKYFSTPLVRHSVSKKLAALLSIDENSFQDFFEVRDLEFNCWNNIESLEVRPVYSPHPVETNIFFFRALHQGRYVTYGHLADIASFEVLDEMEVEDETIPGISRKMLHETRDNYLAPVQLKKIDIGGGLIHGDANDFLKDRSEKKVLSHTSHKLTTKQKKAGTGVEFGAVDVLIPGSEDYSLQCAEKHLREYYPGVPENDLQKLLNCGYQLYGAGNVLLKNNEAPPMVFLILTGSVEFISSGSSRVSILSKGSMVGDMAALFGHRHFGACRTLSHINALTIPADLFKEFVSSNGLLEQIQQIQDSVEFLQQSLLFGESISSPIHSRIAQQMKPVICKSGKCLPAGSGLLLLKKGEIELCLPRKGQEERTIQKLLPGDFWGEETVLFQQPHNYEALALNDSSVYQITDLDLLREIPIVRWKLLEQWEKRQELQEKPKHP